MTEMDITFVIVNWNTKDLLLQCVAAIYQTTTGRKFEIIVVDNGSRDGSVDALQQKFPQVSCIVNPENRGFGTANNQALAVMQGRYAVLVNTDATLTPGAVDTLFTFIESHPEVGMACGQLINPDGSKQNAHASFPSLLTLMANESLLRWLLPFKYPSKYLHYDQPLPVDSCIGACMIVRKTAMNQVGLFDERYFFFFEETDWARQFRQKGWPIYFVPQAQIIHTQGQTAGAEVLARKLFYFSRYQYLRKWHPRQYPMMKAIIATRLCTNVFFNGAAFLLTLGQLPESRIRLRRYLQLLLWHLEGCPFPQNG